MLASLARFSGLEDDADWLEQLWAETAAALGIEEEYHGVWDEPLRPAFSAMIERMLEETSPPRYEPGNSENPGELSASPNELFNRAWSSYEDAPRAYDVWERRAVRCYLRQQSS
jgi:hypothetical protein